MALLVYLLFAAGALALVHFCFQRLGWRDVAAIAAAPLPFVGSALLTGAIYAPIDLPYNAQPLRSMAEAHDVAIPHNGQLSDLYTQMMPWRAAVRHAYSLGEWPHLNPFMLAGDVLAGAAQPAPYHPLTLIGILLPPGDDFTFSAAAALFIAMLGAYCWLRELGCRGLAALVGAFTWMSADFVLFWIGWPIGITASALPWILLAVSRLISRRTAGSVVLLSVVLIWILCAGHPETVLHHVAIGSAFGLWRLRELTAPARVRAVLLAAGAGVLALCVSAIAVLPFVETMGETFESAYRRDVWSQTKKSVGWSHAALNALPSIVPFAYGRSGAQLATVEDADRLIPSNAWAGVIPLALAWLGARRGSRRDRPFLLGLLVLSLWVGSEAPGLTDFLGSLPLFSITLNDRLILGAALVVATFAGLGLESWLAAPSRVRLSVSLLAAAAVIGALAALLAPVMTGVWNLPREFVGAQAAMTLLPAAVAAALVLTVRRAPAAIALVGLLLVAERAMVSGSFYPSVDRAAFYPPFPGLDTLRTGDEPSRMVGRSYTIIPGTAASYGLEDVRGYQAITNARLHQTLDLWSIPQPVWFNRVDDLGAPMLRMLNVRHALVDGDVAPPPGWKDAWRGPDYAILEIEAPLSRAYVPDSVVVTGSRFPESMRANADFEQLSWIGPPIGTESGHSDSVPSRNGEGAIRVEKRGLGFRIHADMQRPGWVVISQVAWNGWRAVDARARELPLHYANHAFLALPLERGGHVVDLAYEPVYFAESLVTTVCGSAALGFLCLLVVFGPRAQTWSGTSRIASAGEEFP